MRRKIKKTVQGQQTIDGAGVHLVRVLGPQTVKDFDPFLMLDSFDSKNPQDYIAGFPMHPHRGIETITYLIEGEMEHQDSLGNEGTIRRGESQWMTAGSGIMHQEMPKASERMLGLQIWLNLPKESKMADPRYFDIKQDMIKTVKEEKAIVRVISGAYKGVQAVAPKYIQASLYDVTVSPGCTIVLPTKTDENVFVFTILGDALIDDTLVQEKTAVLFGDGDEIAVQALSDEEARFIFFSGKPLHEEVAWGGPIVMNTREELQDAFRELETGQFIKHDAVK